VTDLCPYLGIDLSQLVRNGPDDEFNRILILQVSFEKEASREAVGSVEGISDVMGDSRFSHPCHTVEPENGLVFIIDPICNRSEQIASGTGQAFNFVPSNRRVR
jgi:hypothetical protein